MSPEVCNEIVERLLDDKDLSVKKLAIKSVGSNASHVILDKLHALAEGEVDIRIKQLARRQLHLAR